MLAAPAVSQVNVTLAADDMQLQGTHHLSGNLLLFIPDPLSPGSSVSPDVLGVFVYLPVPGAMQ